MFLLLYSENGFHAIIYLWHFHDSMSFTVIPLEYQNNIFIVNHYAAQKMFSSKDFFSKCDQIRGKLKEFLMESFIFCAVLAPSPDISDKSTCKNQSCM